MFMVHLGLARPFRKGSTGTATLSGTVAVAPVGRFLQGRGRFQSGIDTQLLLKLLLQAQMYDRSFSGACSTMTASCSVRTLGPGWRPRR